MAMKVSIIIPTRNAADCLRSLVEGLWAQERRPDEVLVVDSSSTDETVELAAALGCRTHRIAAAEFGHGRTRNLAADLAVGEVLAYFSQDVVPADGRMLGALVAPLERGEAAASYARQIAPPDAWPTERFLRGYLYPQESQVRCLSNGAPAGVRQFFFSNAASAVLRGSFEQVSRFPENTIICEDMLLSAALQQAGLPVAYAAEAQVYHAHQYSVWMQFRRYFDMGVMHATFGDHLRSTPRSCDGIAFAVAQARYLCERGEVAWVPRSVAESAAKWLGMQAGRVHRRLPRRVCRLLSMHRSYW